MPIRFRCAFCHQLMAISRRKAGTVVRCPKCAGDIIVPAPDGTQPAPANDGVGLFDNPNFDAILEKEPPKPAAVRGDPPPASTPDIAQHPRGLFLPIGWLLAAIAAIVVLSALMFLLGRITAS